MLQKRKSWMIGALLCMALVTGLVIGFDKEEGAFAQMQLQRATAPHEGVLLRVATYNIHIGKNQQNELNLQATINTLRESGAEIIGLQEVEKRSPRSGFADQAREIAEELQMNYHFEPALKLWPWEFGNALLSKYPITGVKRIELPSPKEQRVGLLATLEVQSKAVHVLVTHLGLNVQERSEHVQLLHEQLRQTEGAQIVLGDMNARPEQPELQPWMEYLTNTADRPLVTFPGLGEQIDSILVSKEFRVDKVYTIDSQASDHVPLVSDLRLL